MDGLEITYIIAIISGVAATVVSWWLAQRASESVRSRAKKVSEIRKQLLDVLDEKTALMNQLKHCQTVILEKDKELESLKREISEREERIRYLEQRISFLEDIFDKMRFDFRDIRDDWIKLYEVWKKFYEQFKEFLEKEKKK